MMVDRPAPVRVLHVITRMILGGAQENTLLSVEGLDRLPTYDVTLVSGVDRGPEGNMLVRTRETTHLVIVPEMQRDVHPIADAIALWKLYRLIKKGRYHIVHTHLAKAGVLGRVAAWLARTPIIIHGLHGLVFHEYQPLYENRTWWAVQKLCAPITDHYISVSRVISEKAIDAGLASPDNLTTIYSGMELDWFLDANIDTAAVRRELDIPDDAPVLGKIARMVPVKNHEQLLAAAPEIIARYPNVRFLLIGDGPLLDHLRARAAQMGMSDHFIFTGLVPRERIPEMIAVMDVLVHTALYEGLPRVLAQALAMGKPCVACDADGAREVVVPEETGYLVQPGDTSGLAAAVDRLLRDPQLRARMGEAGRRRVDPAFRVETMVEHIDTVYQELLRRHAKRLAHFDQGSGSVRVMRIISRMNIGGPAVHVTVLNSGLNGKGYDCLLVTGNEGATEGSLRDLAVTRGLRMAVIPELGREISLRSDLVTLIKLYRLMRRERPDIVHTHQSKAGFVGRIAARLAGVPIVVHTFHGHIFHGYFSPAKTRLVLLMERIGARLSTRIITISPRLRDEIAGFGVTKPHRIEVIPLGFELEAYATEVRGSGEFRRSLDLPERAKLIGAVGRLVPIKNIPLLLEAAAVARQQDPNIHVVIVGDGELRMELEAQVSALGLDDSVTFAGWRRDLPRVYADLDAVVISSDNEGTPASLIEAMATGCPVVATRVGGVPDLISDGETGRLVPPGDREALTSALLALLREPERTRQMAALARQQVLERHQAGRLVGDVDHLYRELLTAADYPWPSELSGATDT